MYFGEGAGPSDPASLQELKYLAKPRFSPNVKLRPLNPLISLKTAKEMFGKT
jgi:hypothetical protein